MRGTLVVLKRELWSYFATPLAYVLLIVFAVLTAVATWVFGGLYESDQASLEPFFTYLPWILMLVAPALAMRLWSEERRHGTIELLLTLPITPTQAVLGKFLAAWCFLGLALVLTFSEWASVSYLGAPDHGVIAAGYLGAFLMAGSFLALGSLVSALTKSQTLAFVATLIVLILNLALGAPQVRSWLEGLLPTTLVDVVRGLSAFDHFEAIRRGLLVPADLVFFLATIALCLFGGVVVVDLEKGR